LLPRCGPHLHSHGSFGPVLVPADLARSGDRALATRKERRSTGLAARGSLKRQSASFAPDGSRAYAPPSMSCAACLRFVTSKDAEVEELPWGPHEWLARAGLTESKLLQLVRVSMPAGKAHRFHRHPAMEELLYVVEGRVEQWVGREKRVLRPGELAHV